MSRIQSRQSFDAHLAGFYTYPVATPLLTWMVDHQVFIDHIDRALAMMTLITFQVPRGACCGLGVVDGAWSALVSLNAKGRSIHHHPLNLLGVGDAKV